MCYQSYVFTGPQGHAGRYTPEAANRGLTASQVVLAWLLEQKPWAVPIPGTTKAPHLRENLWAAEFTFTPEELAGLTAAVARIPIRGDRYTGNRPNR